jgi:cytochrome oxidase assembly protein ShyY1
MSKASSKYRQGTWHNRDDNKLLEELRIAEAKQQQKRYAFAVFWYSTVTLVVFALGVWLVAILRG